MSYKFAIFTAFLLLSGNPFLTACASDHHSFSQHENLSNYGNPSFYSVNGKRYTVLKSAKGYDKTGIASWYGPDFHGELTSNREAYDMYSMTAASTDLPLPTLVRVTNLDNGRQIIVRVNDRGPFHNDRVIDLSYAAARKLGFSEIGTAHVRVTAISTPVLAHDNNTQHAKQFIQIGAFHNHENAVKFQRELAGYTSYPIHLKADAQDFSTIYRVRIGPFEEIETMEQEQKKLKRHGHDRTMTVLG